METEKNAQHGFQHNSWHQFLQCGAGLMPARGMN
jgi:hypothetical protein